MTTPEYPQYILRIKPVKPKMSMLDYGVAKEARCKVIRMDAEDAEPHTVATVRRKGWRMGLAIERVTAAGEAVVRKDKAKREAHLRAQINKEK